MGRLTAISDGTTYTYNTAGQLTEATTDGTTHTYTYDGDGIRVGVDGQDQLWDRSGSLPMLVDDGESHTWGPTGRLLSTGDQWAHADALGSVRAHTDTAGDPKASIDHRAFGDPTSGWDSFGYTGGIHDPSGLIHLRARQLDPDLGRFTTRDPVQPGAPGTGGYNHYTYTANNPTTWTDPTGQVAVVADTSVSRVPSTLSAVQLRHLGIAAEGVLGLAGLHMAIDIAVDHGPCQLRGDCDRDDDPVDEPTPVPPAVGSEPDTDQRARPADCDELNSTPPYSGGPGTWVFKLRSEAGAAHLARVTGAPIGCEYLLDGVYFDGYLRPGYGRPRTLLEARSGTGAPCNPDGSFMFGNPHSRQL